MNPASQFRISDFDGLDVQFRFPIEPPSQKSEQPCCIKNCDGHQIWCHSDVMMKLFAFAGIVSMVPSSFNLFVVCRYQHNCEYELSLHGTRTFAGPLYPIGTIISREQMDILAFIYRYDFLNAMVHCSHRTFTYDHTLRRQSSQHNL
jgi:hypothetical protein